MRAITIARGPDGSPALVLETVPEPEPGPFDLLVRVRAAGVNRADLTRAGTHYGHGDAPTHAVAGLELAGEVVATGPEVRGFAVGDRVMSMGSRAYAEYARVDHRIALPVPDGFDWPRAAATPVSFLTAHDALVTNGRLGRGDAVLVQAATSGAGIAGVQVARAMGAGRVLGTGGSPDKLERLRALGCDEPINVREADFAGRVLDATGGRGVDVVMDNVGGGALTGNIACAALGGRIVSVGRLGGRTDAIDLDELARKRLSLIGVTFRTRSVEQHAAVARRFVDDLFPALAEGRLAPVVDRCFPLEEAEAAQAFMAANRHFGKVVLTV